MRWAGGASAAIQRRHSQLTQLRHARMHSPISALKLARHYIPAFARVTAQRAEVGPAALRCCLTV